MRKSRGWMVTAAAFAVLVAASVYAARDSRRSEDLATDAVASNFAKASATAVPAPVAVERHAAH